MSDKMFAVVNDLEKQPIFVRFGVVGFWDCPPTRYYAWAMMHSEQGEALTLSAKAGSVYGWDVPEAQLACLAAAEPEAHA